MNRDNSVRRCCFKLLVADVLHFTIKGTIEDMVGNYYNDGLDDTYDYNTTAQ